MMIQELYKQLHTLNEQMDILRRIAERGRTAATGMIFSIDIEPTSPEEMLDLWQHMLDEIERTKKMI